MLAAGLADWDLKRARAMALSYRRRISMDPRGGTGWAALCGDLRIARTVGRLTGREGRGQGSTLWNTDRAERVCALGGFLRCYHGPRAAESCRELEDQYVHCGVH